MVYKRARRVVKKVVKAGLRYAKKRYVNKRGNLRLGKVMRDVATVKRLVNVEKKEVVNQYSGTLAQVDVNASGAVIFDITPNINQGIDYFQRNGNSVKITSAYINLQLIAQTTNTAGAKYVIEFWRPKYREVAMSLGSTGAQLYEANTFSTVIDTNSPRNQPYFRDFKLVARRVIVIRQDQFSSVGNSERQIAIPLKLNYHMRWEHAVPATLMDGQIFCLMRASAGNKSSISVSTLGNIAEQGLNTGVRYGMNCKFYYVDN